MLGATDDGGVSTDVHNSLKQRERERDAQASGSTSRSSGTGGSRTPDDGLLQGEITEATAEVVADGHSGREPILLDRELLSGEAAYTHTHTQRHGTCTPRRCSNGGCGCTGASQTQTRIHSSENNGGGLLPILALAMPDNTVGLESSPTSGLRPQSAGVFRREFNRNPRVADYKSAEEVMELFLNER